MKREDVKREVGFGGREMGVGSYQRIKRIKGIWGGGGRGESWVEGLTERSRSETLRATQGPDASGANGRLGRAGHPGRPTAGYAARGLLGSMEILERVGRSRRG